jgi:putative membrane protein
MNKDLVLREYLAIERTKLANETTLLAYIRTGLYFVVAGSTLGQLIDTQFWKVIGIPLIIIGVALVGIGVYRFRRTLDAIKKSKKHIGNASDDFIRAAQQD